MSITDVTSGIFITKEFDVAPNAGFVGYGCEEFIPCYADVLLKRKSSTDTEKLIFLKEEMLSVDGLDSPVSVLQFCKEENFLEEDQHIITVPLSDIEDVTTA